MTRTRVRLLAVALAAAACALSTPDASAWGHVGHRIVSEAAAERMPPDVAPFFRAASARLSDASLEPDTVLKARDPEEGRRHYINLDALAPYPFDAIPVEYEEAQSRFGPEVMKRSGTLPWRVAGVLKDLTAAMRRKNAPEIVRQAGWLSHYAGDAFQPLHLTKNHDGQESCNQDIHEAFESEMIERGGASLREAVRRGRGSVAAVERPVAQAFRWMRDGYPLVEKILDADRAAMKGLKTEGRDYYESLLRLAGPVAERQLSAAANAVASLWYTAWLDAGRPALPAP